MFPKKKRPISFHKKAQQLGVSLPLDQIIRWLLIMFIALVFVLVIMKLK